MKIVKFLLKAVLWIVAIVLVVVLTLPLWISPVACCVANKVAPGITKTSFHLGSFKLNPYTGRLVIGDLQLGNPTNYTEKNAVDLARLEVKVAMSTLFDKKIRVELVDVGALQVYSAFDAGNFLQIAENAKGEKAKDEGEVVAKVEGEGAQTKVEGQGEGTEKGIQIDRLAIHDVTIKYGIIPIPFALTLTGLGADKEDGMTPAEIYATVKDAVLKSIKGTGAAIGDLGKSAAKALNSTASAAAARATEDASAAATKATDAVGNAANKATEFVGKGIDLGTDGLQKGTELLGSGVKSVGGSVEKIGDGAGKAIKAIGDIFKK